MDWPTTTSASPAAATAASAYSAKPASSSPAGRSTATAPCPRATSSGTTRCQYQACPPAPGMRRKLATPAPYAGRSRPICPGAGGGNDSSPRGCWASAGGRTGVFVELVGDAVVVAVGQQRVRPTAAHRFQLRGERQPGQQRDARDVRPQQQRHHG